jgi:hypothetical protein
MSSAARMRGTIVYAKAAVEAIADLSALSPEQVAGIHKQVDELAGRGSVCSERGVSRPAEMPHRYRVGKDVCARRPHSFALFLY